MGIVNSKWNPPDKRAPKAHSQEKADGRLPSKSHAEESDENASLSKKLPRK